MRGVIAYGLVALVAFALGVTMIHRAWRADAIWDRGVAAAGATCDGSMRLFVLLNLYELDLRYTDADGTARTASTVFVRILDRPTITALGATGDPYEIRYDPSEPSDAVISWEHEGRWELALIGALMLLAALGVAAPVVQAVRDAD